MIKVGVEEKGDGKVTHSAEFTFPLLTNYNSLGFFLFAVSHIKGPKNTKLLELGLYDVTKGADTPQPGLCFAL